MKDLAKLPSMDFPFDVAIKGRETGIMWTGKFKYRRPTIGHRSRIDVMRARLNGDLETVDTETKDFNEAISHLRWTIIESPEWWKDSNFGLDLYDGNVIGEIYSKVMEFEKEWRGKVLGDNAQSVTVSDDTDQPEHQEG